MARKTVILFPDTERALQNAGANIKRARLRRNLCAELVAERAGISVDTLSSIEKGVSTVSIGAYAAVLHSLGMEKDLELLGADEEQKRRYREFNLKIRKRATPREKKHKKGDGPMIYITGDCHGDFEKFDIDIFPEQKEMTKEDFVIICGDFGGIWEKDVSGCWETKLLDELDSKPFTTLFVDGNHENFDRLYSYPVEEWNGGKVHEIRPSVIHLMRGQVFMIAGKKIFTFGGAKSHDISGGILEYDDPDFFNKRMALEENFKLYRVNHYSWWEQELPSEEEMLEGITNLEAHGNEVDFIVSHCCATSTQALIGGGRYKRDYLNEYLEKIRQSVQFKKWFFGHYHNNKNVNAQEILLYEQIIRIV